MKHKNYILKYIKNLLILSIMSPLFVFANDKDDKNGKLIDTIKFDLNKSNRLSYSDTVQNVKILLNSCIISGIAVVGKNPNKIYISLGYKNCNGRSEKIDNYAISDFELIDNYAILKKDSVIVLK